MSTRDACLGETSNAERRHNRHHCLQGATDDQRAELAPSYRPVRHSVTEPTVAFRRLLNGQSLRSRRVRPLILFHRMRAAAGHAKIFI
jgi:hypothetical protein